MIEPYIFFKMLSKSALHNAINGVELTITLRIIHLLYKFCFIIKTEDRYIIIA